MAEDHAALPRPRPRRGRSSLRRPRMAIPGSDRRVRGSSNGPSGRRRRSRRAGAEALARTAPFRLSPRHPRRARLRRENGLRLFCRRPLPRLDRRRLCRRFNRDHRRQGDGPSDPGSGRRQPGGAPGRPARPDRRRRLPDRRRLGPGASVDTQDATIARFGRQIEAQQATIAQAQAQVEASQAQFAPATRPTSSAASLEYDRSLKLAQTNFGSQQRLEQATADRDRTAAELAAAKAGAASAAAALEGAKANLDVLKAQRDEATRQRAELDDRARQGQARSFASPVSSRRSTASVGNKAAEVGNLVAAGHAADGAGAAQRVLRRRQFQGDAARRHQAGAEGRRGDRRARRQDDRGRRCRRSRRPRGRSSRCCRPTTRPAISPRSSSASRSESLSRRTF